MLRGEEEVLDALVGGLVLALVGHCLLKVSLLGASVVFAALRSETQ